MSLHVTLIELREPTLSHTRRAALQRELAEVLDAELRPHLARWTDAARHIDDALAHTLTRALRRDNGYAGQHGDRSAWQWVTQIAKNFVRDQVRREAREAARARDAALRDDAARREADAEAEAATSARAVYARLCELVDRGDAPSAWNEHVHLAFTARWNPQPTDRELVSEGLLSEGDDDPRRGDLAVDRLAQRRRRGRIRLGELLEILVRRGELDEDEASDCAREHRAPYPPAARLAAARGGALS